MEAEYLFARAFEELDQRLAEGSLYAGLRCAAILRQMFADQHTLIAQAKRGYSTKLTFSVLHPRPLDYAALGIAPPDLRVIGDQLENTPAPLVRSNLNLDQFLGFQVANYQGATFSVRDVIKYLADACGGVHLGAPTSRLPSSRPSSHGFGDSRVRCSAMLTAPTSLTIRGSLQPNTPHKMDGRFDRGSCGLRAMPLAWLDVQPIGADSAR